MQIEKSSELFEAGVKELIDLVGSSMGPFGHNVMLTRPNMPGLVFRDGKQIVSAYTPYDSIQNNAVGRLREAAQATVMHAGDGSSTTQVLLGSIYLSVMEQIRVAENAGENVARKIVSDRISEILGRMELHMIENSIKVVREDKSIDIELLRKVATLSANNNEEIGNVVTDLVLQVGANGTIRVEHSPTGKLETEIVAGYVFGGGLYDAKYLPYGQNEVTLEEPYVVLVNDSLLTFDALAPIVTDFRKNSLDKREGKALVLVCADLGGVAQATAIAREMKDGFIFPLFCIRPPRGVNVDDFFEDMSAVTGAAVFSKGRGKRLETFNWNKDAGTAKTIISGIEKTSVVHEATEQPKRTTLAGLVARIEKDLPEVPTEESAPLRERLNRLNGGVGILRIPGETSGKVYWAREVVEDSYRSAQSALKHGVLPGCSKGLLNAFDSAVDADEHDIAALAVLDGLKAILAYNLKNAGATDAVVAKCFDTLFLLNSDETFVVDEAMAGQLSVVAAEIKAVVEGKQQTRHLNSMDVLKQYCVQNAVKAGVLDSAYGVICAVRNTASELPLWVMTKNWIKQ